MNFKPCQLDAVTPCCNRGEICLRTADERREYNNTIDIMEAMLNDLKLPEVDSDAPEPKESGCGNSPDITWLK